MSFQCHTCGASEGSPILTGCRDYYMGNPGEFKYWECKQCALIQLHPIPENLGSFYQSYQVHQKKGPLHEWFRDRLMSHAYIPPAQLAGKKILDFGCGDGWFIRKLQEAGIHPTGFEINPQHAKALEAELGCPIVSNIKDLEPESFDLITLNFVLEHLTTPKETISSLAPLLKKGGKLYATIPNLQSQEAKIFGKFWHGLDAPRHITFYKPETIERLLSAANLKLENLSTFGVPTGFAGSICHTLTKGFNYPLFAISTLPGTLFTKLATDGNYAILANRN